MISGIIIDAQRRLGGVDKLTVLMRLYDMEVKVFRRAMERKQIDTNALIKEKALFQTTDLDKWKVSCILQL